MIRRSRCSAFSAAGSGGFFRFPNRNGQRLGRGRPASPAGPKRGQRLASSSCPMTARAALLNRSNSSVNWMRWGAICLSRMVEAMRRKFLPLDLLGQAHRARQGCWLREAAAHGRSAARGETRRAREAGDRNSRAARAPWPRWSKRSRPGKSSPAANTLAAAPIRGLDSRLRTPRQRFGPDSSPARPRNQRNQIWACRGVSIACGTSLCSDGTRKTDSRTWVRCALPAHADTSVQAGRRTDLFLAVAK